jgi:hypothetical protein
MSKLTEKCRKHLSEDLITLFERPDVVIFVRRYNCKVISVKMRENKDASPRSKIKSKC